jgi:hypothetical protein
VEHLLPTTGLPGLDTVLCGLREGDNIVWQINRLRQVVPFIEAFAHDNRNQGRRVIYFRFADHPPLLDRAACDEVCALEPENGFEPFINAVHRRVREAGPGSRFVFDCLSELAADWSSDRMLGNFFMLTCPFIQSHESIGYFVLRRNTHSLHATRPIMDTTQILVDIYTEEGVTYLHPLKVLGRHSPTLYMLHEQEGSEFRPVLQSSTITEILAEIPWSRLDSASLNRGFWSKTFHDAERLQGRIDAGQVDLSEAEPVLQHLLKMVIAREGQVLSLAEEYMGLPDLLAVRRRMIGTGLIGGKAVGMLLARAIMRRNDREWHDATMEVHDSFYVGSDVYYTYLVQNECWWDLQELKTNFTREQDTKAIRGGIAKGIFPDYIVEQFADMLDYFGQCPIIVRSSSLLEDNFGNAFAGKYDSVFCANQGDPEERLEAFLAAVRTVYASTVSEEALHYREKRGLLHLDEQMGLLIQRVSGSINGDRFFPQAAGVALSFNPYVWHSEIDPTAGVMRLVFGVGTRAVDRSDDDYTRVVALNAPERRPETDFSAVRQYAQRRVDVLDLTANELASAAFEDVVETCGGMPLEMFASRDRKAERELRTRGRRGGAPIRVLTFDRLLAETEFVSDMRRMLTLIERAYRYPVDVEFTVNFTTPDRYRINLVQCRPLQVMGGRIAEPPPADIPPENLLLESHSAIIGRSMLERVDWVLYIVPSAYGHLEIAERYRVARAIGDVVHHERLQEGRIMAIGPGRWGTTSPELGVPVTFTEIAKVSIVCEVVAMHENLIPDVSLGTHFFNELVENNMLYLTHFPDREDAHLNTGFLEGGSTNLLPELLPEAADLAPILRVIPLSRSDGEVLVNANTREQRVVCYRRST